MSELHDPSQNGFSHGLPWFDENLPSDISKRELLINRLVCNEFSVKERTAFLAEIDRWENGWHEVALAFIEEQAFGQAFIADAESQQSETSLIATNHESLIPRKFVSLANATAEKQPLAVNPANTPGRNGFATGWLATGWFSAACVLVSLVGGMLIGHSIYRSADSKVAQGNLENPTTPDDRIAPLPSDESDEPDTRQFPNTHSFVKFPHQGIGLTSEVPVFDIGELTRTSWEHSVSSEAKNALYRGGYRVEPNTEIVRTKFDEHHDLLVPIHKLQVRSVVQ